MVVVSSSEGVSGWTGVIHYAIGGITWQHTHMFSVNDGIENLQPAPECCDIKLIWYW